MPLGLTKYHGMKTDGGVEVYLHTLTSTLDGGEWSVSRPRPLYLRGKILRYPLDRGLGGPQNRAGRGGEEQNSPPLSGIDIQVITAERN
jgi:hypothetical protein